MYVVEKDNELLVKCLIESLTMLTEEDLQKLDSDLKFFIILAEQKQVNTLALVKKMAIKENELFKHCLKSPMY